MILLSDVLRWFSDVLRWLSDVLRWFSDWNYIHKLRTKLAGSATKSIKTNDGIMSKNIWKWCRIHWHLIENLAKTDLLTKSVKIGISLKGYCKNACFECRKLTPKWETRRGHFLVIWFFFAVPDGLGSPNGSQGLQESPRPVQASISIDFGSIWDDFLMIFCIMWATFYLACLIIFLVTSSLHFQISGHKFKCVGVVRRGQ